MPNKEPFIERVKLMILYFLVFSLCFQTVLIYKMQYLSLTWAVLFMYYLANMFTFKKSFAINKDVRYYVLPVALLWLLMLMMTYINYEPYARMVYAEIRQILLGIILLYIMINHLKGKKIEQDLLLYYFISSVTVLGISYIIGLQVSYSYDGRLSVWGNNSNYVSLWAGMSIMILLNILFYENKNIYFNLVIILLVVLFLQLMAKTGSRGGFASFILGYVVYFLMIKKPLKTKANILIGSSITGALGMLYMLNSPVMKQRIADQLEDKTYGGRQAIWDEAIYMFKEYPIFGIGAGKYENKFIIITGRFAALHNEYLTILLYAGIVGLCLFIYYQYHLLKGIMRFPNKNSALMYSFMAMYLVWMFTAGGALPSLTTWFLWGIISLSGTRQDIPLKKDRHLMIPK